MISTFPPDALIWNKAYAVINIYEVNEFLLNPKSQTYGIWTIKMQTQTNIIKIYLHTY